MRILKFAVVAALLSLPMDTARASVLGSVLTFDGNPDILQDESRAFQIAGGAPGLIDDVFIGWLQITSAPLGPGVITPPSLVGIYSFTITGGAGTNASPFTLGATSGVNSLTSIAPTLTGASGATAGELASSIYVLGGDPGVFDATSLSGGAGLAGALSELTTIDTSLTYQATAGLDGVDDFLQAVSAGSGFFEDGGLTVFDSVLGDVEFLDLTGIYGGDHDLVLSGSVAGPPTGNIDTPWGFTDQLVLIVNVVPEATTFVVWSLLASVAGSFAYRRNRS